jgi:hypothetical protein
MNEQHRNATGVGSNLYVRFDTYTTFSELFCVDGRGEIQSPRVVGHGIFPVDEAFRRLPYPRPWKRCVLEAVAAGTVVVTYPAGPAAHPGFCRPASCRPLCERRIPASPECR